MPSDAEQLWARRVGELTFEICCIPFFIYDVSLGDIVRTDHNFQLEEVIEQSGRYVLRVWFLVPPEQQVSTINEITNLGGSIERSSDHLVAIDLRDKKAAESLSEFLAGLEQSGTLEYETGRS